VYRLRSYFTSVFKNNMIVLTLVLIIHILFLSRIFELWIQYATLELYSYLIITPIVVGLLYYGLIDWLELSFSTWKIIVFTTQYLVGALLLFLSNIHENLSDQLILAGAVFIVNSIVGLYLPKGKIYLSLIMIPVLLIMVPLPQWIVYQVSAVLTRYLLKIAIPFSSFIGVPLDVEEYGGFTVVRVIHNNQYVDFNIAPICSGIIGLFSVLAISPLIIYLNLKGTYNVKRRILGSVISIVVFTILMFLANVLRLTLVFLFTHLYGLEVGYNFFHYTPELIIVIPIIIILVKIINITSGNPRLIFQRKTPRANSVDERKYLGFIPLLLLIPIAIPLVSVSLQTPTLIFTDTDNGPVTLLNVSKGEKQLFIPSIHNGIRIGYIGRQYEMEQGLGPTHRIHLYRGVLKNYGFLDIYIEFSTHPTIHIWELCLWWQNITVINTTVKTISVYNGSILFSFEEIYYSSEQLNGFLISWRYKYYTEKGIEPARFTIMVNKPPLFNITRDDVEFAEQLAIDLINSSIDACYCKYARLSGFKLEYFVNTIIPIYASILIAVIIYESILRVEVRKSTLTR